MKVATWRGEDRFTLDEAPDPVAEAGQVVVKVDTVGICGSDVHLIQGLFPGEPPRILGHEFSGVIVETGPGVDESIRGRGVVAIPTWVCGDCAGCRAGMRNICVDPLRTFGLAEYAVMPEYNALQIPPGLDMQTAAIMEPSACCLSGLEMFEMPQDAVVLVMGAGVMGLMTAAFAKLRGARTVIMSEPIESRRNLAAELGADMVIDPTTGDLDGLISDLTNGLGAHVVCEAVGKPSLVEQAIKAYEAKGKRATCRGKPAGQHVACRPVRHSLPRTLDPRGVRGRRGLPQSPGLTATGTGHRTRSDYVLPHGTGPRSIRGSSRSGRCEGRNQA